MDAITLEKVFGSDGAQFINLTGTLVEAIEREPPTYTYMAPDEFNSLIERDLKAGIKIYWEELLGRAHLAAVASIIRAYRLLLCILFLVVLQPTSSVVGVQTSGAQTVKGPSVVV